MTASGPFLSPAEAAARLGVSAKALRVYEQRGLLSPIRSANGWRVYGPGEMARAAEIATLRALGLSLARIGRVLGGDAATLEPALAQHQAALEEQIRALAATVARVGGLRAGLARDGVPAPAELAGLADAPAGPAIAFDLPWPWGGERFALRDGPALTFITGPLGSGKTRLARRIAESLPGAAFIGTDRAERAGRPPPGARAEAALAWLAEDGATMSEALTALVAALTDEGPSALVIDMIEQGLDQATQEAVMAFLRRPGADRRQLFLLTRSAAILDLGAVGREEAILFCPANHAPPIRVVPCPGAPGTEAVATCLATPEVRARTEGVIAWRPPARHPA